MIFFLKDGTNDRICTFPVRIHVVVSSLHILKEGRHLKFLYFPAVQISLLQQLGDSWASLRVNSISKYCLQTSFGKITISPEQAAFDEI